MPFPCEHSASVFEWHRCHVRWDNTSLEWISRREHSPRGRHFIFRQKDGCMKPGWDSVIKITYINRGHTRTHVWKTSSSLNHKFLWSVISHLFRAEDCLFWKAAMRGKEGVGRKIHVWNCNHCQLDSIVSRSQDMHISWISVEAGNSLFSRTNSWTWAAVCSVLGCGKGYLQLILPNPNLKYSVFMGIEMVSS